MPPPPPPPPVTEMAASSSNNSRYVAVKFDQKRFKSTCPNESVCASVYPSTSDTAWGFDDLCGDTFGSPLDGFHFHDDAHRLELFALESSRSASGDEDHFACIAPSNSTTIPPTLAESFCSFNASTAPSEKITSPQFSVSPADSGASSVVESLPLSSSASASNSFHCLPHSTSPSSSSCSSSSSTTSLAGPATLSSTLSPAPSILEKPAYFVTSSAPAQIAHESEGVHITPPSLPPPVASGPLSCTDSPSFPLSSLSIGMVIEGGTKLFTPPCGVAATGIVSFPSAISSSSALAEADYNTIINNNHNNKNINNNSIGGNHSPSLLFNNHLLPHPEFHGHGEDLDDPDHDSSGMPFTSSAVLPLAAKLTATPSIDTMWNTLAPPIETHEAPSHSLSAASSNHTGPYSLFDPFAITDRPDIAHSLLSNANSIFDFDAFGLTDACNNGAPGSTGGRGQGSAATAASPQAQGVRKQGGNALSGNFTSSYSGTDKGVHGYAGAPYQGNNGASGASMPLQRTAHNAMERERRVNLRRCFDSLRAVVPRLHDSKAPALHVLNEATQYVLSLRAEEIELASAKARLIKENSTLHALVSQLKVRLGDKHCGNLAVDTPAVGSELGLCLDSTSNVIVGNIQAPALDAAFETEEAGSLGVIGSSPALATGQINKIPTSP